ncbi:AMP-binding protein [Noviherbaspirillum pedocola]|uniref:Long-chain-fatty-acid--CoA ligase n=1 Tax=Noviherbaspirillum pedocola TaxID=2801341 RepID=A0A934SYG7_9BURK|nr:AMP-binding protein [Noviherbaspirillum pedocola]MBK4737630.1 AMP-binding protein [Noviherbaspirillum pedocola]
MEKTWLQSYPSGVPAEADLHAFDTLPALQRAVCARHGAKPAFSNEGATLSFARIDALSRAFAAHLQTVAGLSDGDRVALMLPNLLQYPVALFGALRAGCVVVNINPMYTARELERQLADAGASAIVVLENFAHTLQAALPRTMVRHVIVTRVGDLLPFPKSQIANLLVRHVRHLVPDWDIAGAVRFVDALHTNASALREPRLARDDLAFLQYTGGTTGTPKGAMLTHGNLVSNLQQTLAWIDGVLKDGEECAVIPLPLYHIFALTCMLAFFRIGAHNVLITDPRDMPRLVRRLAHTPFTAMIGVNTLFNALLGAPGIAQVNHGHVKLVVAGGMAVQRPVAERWHAVFGVPLVEGYGLTETSPIVCANRLDATQYTGAIGLPLPSTEVTILDDDGHEMAPGAQGEICVHGPQVMKGYWHRPDETEKVFTADGWLRTGDIGCMDEHGYFRLVDRKKDVIVVSGFKVFPNEVEEVAAMHPGVLEAAAIPAGDERSEQAVKLVVVRRDPELDAGTLREHCRRHLAAYKVPRFIEFQQEPLPKSNVGKVLRRLVREQHGAPARRTGEPA